MVNKYDNKRKEMTINCDFCASKIVLCGTFQDTVKQAQKDGWKVYKDNERWVHKCIDCFKKGVK